MMTCFSMIELQHSVRAHGDIEYKQLQAITRMNPFPIVNNYVIKQEFYELAGRILTYVPNWDNARITPNMMRSFSRKNPAQDALNKYRESIKIGLRNDGTNHVIVKSIDSQHNQGTNADFITASVKS